MSKTEQEFDHYEVAAMRGEFSVLASSEDKPYWLCEIACFHDRERAELYAAFCNDGGAAGEEPEVEPEVDRDNVWDNGGGGDMPRYDTTSEVEEDAEPDDVRDNDGAEDGKNEPEEDAEPIVAAETPAAPKPDPKPEASPATTDHAANVLAVVEHFNSGGGVSKRQIVERTGLKKTTTRHWLQKLKSQGLIRSEGATNSARWFLADGATPEKAAPAETPTADPETMPRALATAEPSPETPTNRLIKKCLYWLMINVGTVAEQPGGRYFLEGAKQAMSAKSLVHLCNDKRKTQGLEPFEEAPG